jgi:hypothetical protein
LASAPASPRPVDRRRDHSARPGGCCMNQTSDWSLAVLWSALEVMQTGRQHPDQPPSESASYHSPWGPCVGLQTKIDNLPGPMKASAPRPHAGGRTWTGPGDPTRSPRSLGRCRVVCVRADGLTLDHPRAGEPALSARSLPKGARWVGLVWSRTALRSVPPRHDRPVGWGEAEVARGWCRTKA